MAEHSALTNHRLPPRIQNHQQLFKNTRRTKGQIRVGIWHTFRWHKESLDVHCRECDGRINWVSWLVWKVGCPEQRGNRLLYRFSGCFAKLKHQQATLLLEPWSRGHFSGSEQQRWRVYCVWWAGSKAFDTRLESQITWMLCGNKRIACLRRTLDVVY